MSSVVVVGTQWGDEGKGKITDFLAEKADVVVNNFRPGVMDNLGLGYSALSSKNKRIIN